MKRIKELEKFGLSEKEAQVYVACLELGNGSALRIAEKAKQPKSTTYDVLKNLSKKGMVTMYIKKKTKYFSTSDPIILKKTIQKQKEALESMWPELQALYNTAPHKPTVKFYEGKSGFRFVMNEILNEAKELISLSSIEDVWSTFSDFFPEFPEERTKRRIPIRIISRDSKKARERQKTGRAQLRTVKIMQTDIPFKSMLMIWNNKIALMSLGDDVIILIIESRDLVLTFKAMFELLWRKK